MIRRTQLRTTLVSAAAALLVLSAMSAGQALAQADDSDDRADCSILEIKASNGEGGVDNALKPLLKKLKKPPFSSWKTFELLKRHAVKIVRMKALNLDLVPGGKLSLLYRDSSSAGGKKRRLRLGFTLDDKKGKRKLDGTIKLDSGDYYLIGGSPLEGGATYILAVACEAK